MTPQEEAAALAAEIMQLCRTSLLTELRFLAPALCRMPAVDDPACGSLATDGLQLRYHFVYVLRRWRDDRRQMLRAFLHMVLHCLFCHPFAEPELPACWDLACDIATEAVIRGLGLASVERQLPEEAVATLAELNTALDGRLTAERIYRYYADSGLTESRLEQLRLPFEADDHSLWSGQSRSDESGKSRAESEEEDNDQKRNGRNGDTRSDRREDDREGGRSTDGQREQASDSAPAPRSAGEPEGDWKRIAAQVQTELESFCREWADRAGGLLLNVREARQTHMKFRDFLKRFALITEVPEVDADSWDPILYAYGLSIYRDMPLVEPLEYAERHRIRELVIVLDTSGSVQGEKVQAFLNQTATLLLSEGTMDRRVELHILECDADVQRDTVIRSVKELEELLPRLQLHGGGGTDFRPAFAHIAELRRRGALSRLRGILYLTDGEGTYPAEPPPCDTAFLFVDRGDLQARVPPWAMRVLL